jgi:hypothetical protein
MVPFGRIALCGAISSYNDEKKELPLEVNFEYESPIKSRQPFNYTLVFYYLSTHGLRRADL